MALKRRLRPLPWPPSLELEFTLGGIPVGVTTLHVFKPDEGEAVRQVEVSSGGEPRVELRTPP